MEKIPIRDKYLLTLGEAAEYFNININKLREMTSDTNCDYILLNGTKKLIKKDRLEKYLDSQYII